MEESDCEFMSDNESTASYRFNKSIAGSCTSAQTEEIAKSKALKKTKSINKSKKLQQSPYDFVSKICLQVNKCIKVLSFRF